MSSGSTVSQHLALKCRVLEAWERGVTVSSLSSPASKAGQSVVSIQYMISLKESIKKKSPSAGISRLSELAGWIFPFPCAVRVSRQGHPNSMMSCNGFVCHRAIGCETSSCEGQGLLHPKKTWTLWSEATTKNWLWSIVQAANSGCKSELERSWAS